MIAGPLALLLAWSASAEEPARVLLTFDDGPDPATTTQVLDELDRRRARAVFFVLTGPETVRGRTFPKAETEAGFEVLLREVRDGHLVQCHWGGTYVSQLRLQPPRLDEPAYDATGDGVVDRVTDPGNALESDLLQCRARIEQALQAVASEGAREVQPPGSVAYVRPPVWRYRIGDHDVRPTYRALGLRMVLTDHRLVDGGYPWQSVPRPRALALGTARALRAGRREVVLTLHDSNARTARRLAATLDTLERTLARRGLVRGEAWAYARDLEEVRSALDAFLARARYEP